MNNYKVPKGYKLVKAENKQKDGLSWWTAKARGFKVVETGLTYKAKSGVNYPAVKVEKDGKTLLLKGVRGCSVYTAKDF
jgi:hypothetical protein